MIQQMITIPVVSLGSIPPEVWAFLKLDGKLSQAALIFLIWKSDSIIRAMGEAVSNVMSSHNERKRDEFMYRLNDKNRDARIESIQEFDEPNQRPTSKIISMETWRQSPSIPHSER